MLGIGVGALIAVSACQDGGANLTSAAGFACLEPSRDPAFNGLALSASIKQLGQASSDEVFALGENAITEFRIEILNKYPLPREKGRNIRELQWTNGYCNTAIWFVEMGEGWTSFDNLTWSDDTLF